MFDLCVLWMGLEIFLIGAARFLAASDALADLAEIVPGIPILGRQLDNPFPAEIGGLNLVALLEPLSKRVEFRRRQFPTIGRFAALPRQQADLHGVVDPTIDLAHFSLRHEGP